MAFLVSNDNQEKFAIPNGETTIGRGPYLRVKEVSLSRSHAVVSLNNGKVSIKPTHKNPTYFYSSDSVENCVVLEKDKWKELVDGDSISLLSNSYKYSVEITCSEVSDVNHTQSNDDNAEEIENDVVDGTVNKPTSPYLSTTLCDVDSECINENNVVEVSSNFETSPKSTNKRKLPPWMAETDSPGKKKKTVQRTPISKEEDTCLTKVTSPVDSPVKSDVTSCFVSPGKSNEQSIPNCISDPGTDKHPEKQIPQVETSPLHESCYEIHIKDEQTVPKSPIANMAHNKQTVDESLKEDNTHVAQIAVKSPIVNMPEDEDTLSAKSTTAETSQGEHTELHSSSPVVADLSDDDEQVAVKSPVGEIYQDEHSNNSFTNDQPKDINEEENMESKEGSSQQQDESGNLKPCPYGKKCYRKNPVHFVEYSHASKNDDDDDDDDDSEQSSDGNKTECPYGMKCYRQNNPHHTSKFTHTSRTRKQNKKRGKSLLDKETDNDGENKYDLDDSFIDSTDDSDSGGYTYESSDSDYVPPGCDDDEDEDLDELISEASGFLRNKKM